MSFFLILALAGITINIIFQNAIQKILSREGFDTVIIEHVSKYFAIIGSGVTIAGILITLLIAFFLSKNITSPLNKLTNGMLELAQGKWNTRIIVKSHDEVGQLAEGFNFMAEHIEKSLKELKTAKEFTDNIVASVPSIMIILSNKLNILSTN